MPQYETKNLAKNSSERQKEHLGLLTKLFPQSMIQKSTLTFTLIKKLVLGPSSSEQVKPGMHKSSKKVRHASKFKVPEG
jgi:hypothetical protein